MIFKEKKILRKKNLILFYMGVDMPMEKKFMLMNLISYQDMVRGFLMDMICMEKQIKK